ncbi:MAG TPA: FkbM family methyltransferase [Verrucomicrobiae bacterium]
MKKLPDSGVIYRAVRLESIPLATEMFQKGNLYDASLLPQNFNTFVDLGCNVGYFTCWLAHLARGRSKIRGLMIDANPDAVKESQWHMQANQLDEVFAINGIVGEGRPGEVSEFFLYESNICSMSHLTEEVRQNLKGRWTKILVPAVNLDACWQQHFDNTRCNLLKIDIEGSEMNFLRNEQSFLKLVDAILIEWHAWGASLNEIQNILAAQGFSLVKIIEESPTMGTAFFRR